MFSKFKYRSDQAELMDEPDVPKELLHANLRELDLLNRWSAGNAITLQGLKKLCDKKDKSYHIVDLGCGSGDLLKHIAIWARKQKLSVRLTGVDKNPDAIGYLRKLCKDYSEIEGVTKDYNEYLEDNEIADIYLCSLFCHHLEDEKIRKLFHKIKSAKSGFVINDLIRSPIAYYAAIAFTRIARGTPLSKNDGPISVLRGFNMQDMRKLLAEAGIRRYEIRRKGGYRLRVVVKNEE